MYAKKHRPMQKLTAICLSVTIAAASLLSGHVFASDEAPQTDYLTGWELLAELREMGLGQDVIPDEEAPESDNSSETNTEDPSDTTGEPGDGDQTDGTEPGNPDEGGSGEGDPDPGESTPEQPGDGDQTGGTEPGNPDGNNPGEGGSGEGDTDTDTDPGTDNPDNSDPAASTDPDEGDGAEQDSDQNQPSAPAESTESAPDEPTSKDVPLVTQNDEITVNDPQIPGETPAAPEEDNDKDPAPSDEQTPSEDPGDDGTTTTPGDDNTSQNPDENPGGETTTPPEEETGDNQVPSGGDEIDPGFGVDPSTPIEEIPETSGITEEQRAELEAYVQTLEAEQVVSLDGTDITVQEYEDLCSMVTEEQLLAIEELLTPQYGVDFTNVAPPVDSGDLFVTGPAQYGAMLFSFSALDSYLSDSEMKDDPNLVTEKTASIDEDGNVTIEMDAYTIGTVQTTPGQAKPADVVLVLDVSGSMNQGLERLGQYYEISSNLNTDETYAYYTDRSYYVMQYRSGRWQYQYTDRWGNIRWGAVPYYGNVYNTKMHALKNAVNLFIHQMEEQNAQIRDEDLKNRLAIVKFAMNGEEDDYYSYGNNRAHGNGSRVIADMQKVSGANVDNLIATVNELNPEGATAADRGLEKAKEALDDAQNLPGDRQKIVVMFTDGEPTHWSEWSNDVANGAISAAYDLKNEYGATVYSIGIFENADPTYEFWRNNDNKARFNRYMHFVSSNYKSAQSMNSNFRGNWVEITEEDSGFYLSASDSTKLEEIFKKIGDGITGGTASTLDSNAVVKDIISPYFNVPDQVGEGKVEAWIVPCTSYSEEDKLADFELDQSKWTRVDESKITINADGVEVTGFDFKNYFVRETIIPERPANEKLGYKLHIEITTTAKDEFLGGNAVPTNGDASGVYSNEGDASDPSKVVENFPRPSVNVPIHYSFDVTDKTIYLSQSQKIDFAAGGVFHDGGKAAKQLGGNAKANDYVNITYTVMDSEGNPVGTYTITPGTGVGSWGADVAPPELTPEDCEELTITCTVTSKNTHNPQIPGGDQTNWTASDAEKEKVADIHVLKPTLNFKDTYEDGPTNNYALTENQKDDFITWSDFNTGHAANVASAGEAPDVTLHYTWMEKPGEVITDGKVNLTETANFKVEKITIGTEDYTSFEVDTFMNGKVDYRVTTDCSYDDNDSSLADEHEKSRHFTVHLPSEFDLTITKARPDDYVAGETFRFTVRGDNDFYAEFTLGEFTDGTEDWSITLQDLKPGRYTITEDQGWSWRYETVSATVNDAAQSLTNGGFTKDFNENASVTFTNTKTNNHWLSWEDTIQNIFKAS